MKMTNDFQQLLSNYLLNELPIIQNQSKNTITSYRDTYIQLLQFMVEIKNIKVTKLR